MDSSALDDRIFEAARTGNAVELAALLDSHPEKLNLRAPPYEFTLLHAGASHLAVVDLLLERGLDVNAREKGDNTYAMHWAAAAGELEVVRRLADAGGDVVGHGDDHQLDVIGWATSWEGCDDDRHRAVADFLVSRGARHHIFSAIAMNLADEVRNLVASDPSALNRRMSRNENHQLALHFAVGMNRPEMVSLLIELGADPLGVDGSGYTAAMYATSPTIDLPVMERIGAMTSAELTSALRGDRQPQIRTTDLLAALALDDLETAERLWGENPGTKSDNRSEGLLHLTSKRGDSRAIQWLLRHGSDPNAKWAHWDSDVTPLHLAVLGGHRDAVIALLAAGADPRIHDSKHDSDAAGWAEFFGRTELADLLRAG